MTPSTHSARRATRNQLALCALVAFLAPSLSWAQGTPPVAPEPSKPRENPAPSGAPAPAVPAAPSEPADAPIRVVELSAAQLEQVCAGESRLSALFAKAELSLGVPYAWGGSRLMRGIDCSNFTWQLYRSQGLPYRRYMNTRRLAGVKSRNGLEAIEFADARAGDLLVYGSKADGRWHGHVVILVDADGSTTGQAGVVLGAHGGTVRAVRYVTFTGFAEGYYKTPDMKLVNVLRARGLHASAGD